MGKLRKTKVVLEFDDKPKKDLQHGASASSDSNMKTKSPAPTASFMSDEKTVDVHVTSSSSAKQNVNSTKISSQASSGADVSSVGQVGNAVKDEKKRPADIVVQHKFK
jgi:hypothetical protein